MIFGTDEVIEIFNSTLLSRSKAQFRKLCDFCGAQRDWSLDTFKLPPTYTISVVRYNT